MGEGLSGFARMFGDKHASGNGGKFSNSKHALGVHGSTEALVCVGGSEQAGWPLIYIYIYIYMYI